LDGGAAGCLITSVAGVTFAGARCRSAATTSTAPDRATAQAPAAAAHMARADAV